MIEWSMIKTSKIRPNPENPRFITNEKFEALKKSIREFPEMLALRPLVIDKDNVVLGGNMRLRACDELGIEEVPVIRAENLSDAQRERFIIVDNLPFGQWDYDILNNEWDIDILNDWGFDFMGFEEPEEATEDAREEKQKITLNYSPEEYIKLMQYFESIGGSKESIIYNLIFPNE